VIEPSELRALEDEVSVALKTRDPGRLPLLGQGEISLVLGWPPDHPRVACKRLPPFRDATAFGHYARVVRQYVDELRAGGVRVVETDLQHLVRPDGHVVGFHVQPVLPAGTIGVAMLRSGDASHGHPILPAVVDAVVGVTHPRLGVDSQLSNWAWLNGEPWQLDLTTPFLLDEHRRPAFDLTPFLAVLPAPVRPLVQREMRALIRRWTTARGALLDMTANLLKERLDAGRGGAGVCRRPAALAAPVPARARQPMVAAERAPPPVRVSRTRAHDVRRYPCGRAWRDRRRTRAEGLPGRRPLTIAPGAMTNGPGSRPAWREKITPCWALLSTCFGSVSTST